MATDIKCKLVSKLQVQNGNSARGPWSKQDFIVETEETYPKKICMNVWGADKVAELGTYNPGDDLMISINIESREFNGRWYTDVRAWKIQREQNVQAGQMPAQAQTSQGDPFMNVASDHSADGEGDLPF
ncbi:MAG: DUF3127 domain-containing protein [Bacteroidales bacterium]